MADNVTLNPGVGGSTVATDDIGGIMFQRVKMVVGSDGVNGGDVAPTNPMPAQERRPTASAVTSVVAAATNTTLLITNVARKAAYFYNNSTSALYLKLGVTATNISFTHKLEGGESWMLPYPGYTGQIDGIWDSADGAVLITELS